MLEPKRPRVWIGESWLALVTCPPRIARSLSDNTDMASAGTEIETRCPPPDASPTIGVSAGLNDEELVSLVVSGRPAALGQAL